MARYHIYFPDFPDKNGFYSRNVLLQDSEINNEIFNGEENQLKEKISDFMVPKVESSNIDDLKTPINKGKERSWSKGEVRLLMRLIACFDGNDVDWEQVSKAMISNNYGRSRAQCEKEWIRELKDDKKMPLWTDEEDKRLLEIVQRLGEESWMKVAREMEQRSDVQCRYRYYRLLKNKKALMCPQIGEAPILNQQQTDPCQAPSTYSPVQTNGIVTFN